MSPPDFCPFCRSDQRGEPIAERLLHHNAPGQPFYDPDRPSCEQQVKQYGRCHCLPYGAGVTHYSRTVAIEAPEARYDGALYWLCPDCGMAWHRFDSAHMRAKAQPYIDRNNAIVAESAKVDPAP